MTSLATMQPLTEAITASLDYALLQTQRGASVEAGMHEALAQARYNVVQGMRGDRNLDVGIHQQIVLMYEKLGIS